MSYVSAALPENARATSYDVPGGPLAGMELVPAHPRGTVLLIPGFSGSKEDFGPLVPLLASAGWRVVALDLRGQYESPGPDDPMAYTVDALAADVLAVVALLAAPVHLVGHSFGGLVCRRTALLGAESLASLALMSSGPAALTGPRVDVLALLPDVLASGGMAAVADASAALAALDPAAQDPAAQHPAAQDPAAQHPAAQHPAAQHPAAQHPAAPEAVPGPPPEVAAFLRQRWLASSGPGLLGMAAALRTEPDRVDALRATGLPLLVLHGEDDDAWSPAVQADMADRLGAVYEVVPQARHSPAVERPETTAAGLLAFWG